jgi:MOSC domain-containing protein YiiM
MNNFAMTVEHIYLAGKAGEAQVEAQSIHVVVGTGIKGDRYFAAKDEPGQNITLVEAEEIEAFCTESGRMIDFSCTRRNLVTRGVRLNALVGQEFTIGTVRLRGVELCEPCRSLGKRLATADLSSAAVVKRLLNRGGLRADILCSGSIAVGARVSVDE